MSEIVGIALVVTIFNFIGGSIRWLIGSIWGLLTNKPNTTFQHYLYGPKKSKNRTDLLDHSTANGLLGAAIFFIIATIIITHNI